MSVDQILMFIGGLLFSVIGYFLKTTMDDLRGVKEMVIKTKSELDVLKNEQANKHQNLSDKIDDMREDIRELKDLIKELHNGAK
jgi:TolA-binding protein